MSERISADEKQQILENMFLDMQLFAETCFPSACKIKAPAFHRQLYDAYADETLKQILCVAPRHHAKSTVTAQIFPLHHILFNYLFGGGPRLVVLVSKTATQAKRLLASIKNVLETSEELRYFFGDWGANTAKQWTSEMVVLKDDSCIMTLGTGQQIHGLKHLDQRPTLLVVDDPEDDANTRTQEATSRNLDWLIKAVIPALDEDEGRVVVIGTMILRGCIVDSLKGVPGWKVLWFDAIVDEDKKLVLWPEKFSWENLEAKRIQQAALGREHIWYMNYRNMIVGTSKQPFKEEYMKRWAGEYLIDVKNRKGLIVRDDGWCIPINIFYGFDPASSTSSRADYTVFGFIGRDHRDNIYVLWYYREQAEPYETGIAFVDACEKFAPLNGNIETFGYQEALASQIRHECIARGMRIPGVEKKNNTQRGAKSSRILSNVWRFAEGKVFTREEHGAFRTEHLNYVPNKESQHEDCCDFFYWAVKDSYPASEDWYYGSPSKFGLGPGSRYDDVTEEEAYSWMGC